MCLYNRDTHNREGDHTITDVQISCNYICRTKHSWTTQGTVFIGCNVNPSPTDVSLTKIYWILRPLDKVSLEYYVPDQTILSLGVTDVMMHCSCHPSLTVFLKKFILSDSTHERTVSGLPVPSRDVTYQSLPGRKLGLVIFSAIGLYRLSEH
jgi:hypothetical protein